MEGKDPADAASWGWDVVKLGCTAIAVIGLPMLLFPRLILPVFTSDPSTVELAAFPLMLSGLFLTIDCVGLILTNAMQGAGYARVPMFVSIGLQWGLYLPLCYLVGPVLGLGLTAVWIIHICYRTIQSIVMAILWKKRSWQYSKV